MAHCYANANRKKLADLDDEGRKRYWEKWPNSSGDRYGEEDRLSVSTVAVTQQPIQWKWERAGESCQQKNSMPRWASSYCRTIPPRHSSLLTQSHYSRPVFSTRGWPTYTYVNYNSPWQLLECIMPLNASLSERFPRVRLSNCCNLLHSHVHSHVTFLGSARQIDVDVTAVNIQLRIKR